MNSEHLHFANKKVPMHLDEKYRTLIYLTDFENAEKIASRRAIFGRYHAYSKRFFLPYADFFVKSFAKCSIDETKTVALQFKWQGDQFFCHEDLIGVAAKGPEYTNKLLHLCFPQNEFSCDSEEGYAQSILYPHSNLLKLEKIYFTESHNAYLSSANSIFNRKLSIQKPRDIMRLSNDSSGSNIVVV